MTGPAGVSSARGPCACWSVGGCGLPDGCPGVSCVELIDGRFPLYSLLQSYSCCPPSIQRGTRRERKKPCLTRTAPAASCRIVRHSPDLVDWRSCGIRCTQPLRIVSMARARLSHCMGQRTFYNPSVWLGSRRHGSARRNVSEYIHLDMGAPNRTLILADWADRRRYTALRVHSRHDVSACCVQLGVVSACKWMVSMREG